MAHSETKDSGGSGSQPDSRPGESGAPAPEPESQGRRAHDASTAQLIATLQLRLDLLRKSGDPQLSAIARQLEKQLTEIRGELGGLGECETDKDAG